VAYIIGKYVAQTTNLSAKLFDLGLLWCCIKKWFNRL